MTSPERNRKRPHSAQNDKYLTKTVKYLYSPYKKKASPTDNIDKKAMAIQSTIDRIFSSINKTRPLKNMDLKTFKTILRESSPFREKDNGDDLKAKSQNLTPKTTKIAGKSFASQATKSLIDSSSGKKKKSVKQQSLEPENFSALQSCQEKIDYYQKLYEDQCKEKKLLQQLIDSIKNEINKSEKDQTKMNKSSSKFFFEKELGKKTLAKQETSSQNLNKEMANISAEIMQLQEELAEIQNLKTELKLKVMSEEDKSKKMMELTNSLKKEISHTNRSKEKIKNNLMTNNRKLNGFLEKINILEKEKRLFVSKLKTTVAMS